VRAAAVKAGVEISCYGGRHSAASRARAEFGEDGARALLGHRSMDMTAHYGSVDIKIAAAVAARLA
jgi:integrase